MANPEWDNYSGDLGLTKNINDLVDRLKNKSEKDRLVSLRTLLLGLSEGLTNQEGVLLAQMDGLVCWRLTALHNPLKEKAGPNGNSGTP